MDRKVAELGFNTRICNGLERAGVETVGDLLGMDWLDFVRLRNIGKKSQAEIIRKLEEMGFECDNLKEMNVEKRTPRLSVTQRIENDLQKELVRYRVVRDYTGRAPGVGIVACADFMDEEDALEYFFWVKQKWENTAKKRGEPIYVWQLYKCTFHSGQMFPYKRELIEC